MSVSKSSILAVCTIVCAICIQTAPAQAQLSQSEIDRISKGLVASTGGHPEQGHVLVPDSPSIPINLDPPEEKFGDDVFNPDNFNKFISEVDPERSLFVRDPEILKWLTFSNIMRNLSEDGTVASARKLFQQWWRTAGPVPGIKFPNAINCDYWPQHYANGYQVLMHGYSPYTCPRRIRELALHASSVIDAQDPGKFIVVAAVNRRGLGTSFDAAPPTLEDLMNPQKREGRKTCGEFRLIVSHKPKWKPAMRGENERRSNETIFDDVSLSVEAVLPAVKETLTPHPKKKDTGDVLSSPRGTRCAAIQRFWHRLSDKQLTKDTIGKRLRDFFFNGVRLSAEGKILSQDDSTSGFQIGRVIQRDNLGGTGQKHSGQIRTNINSDKIWMLREYKFVPGNKHLQIAPLGGSFDPHLLRSAPNIDKQDEIEKYYKAEHRKRRTDLIKSLRNSDNRNRLLRRDVNKFTFDPAPSTFAFEMTSSALMSGSYRYVLHRQDGEKCATLKSPLASDIAKMACGPPLFAGNERDSLYQIRRRLEALSCSGCHGQTPAGHDLGHLKSPSTPPWNASGSVLWKRPLPVLVNDIEQAKAFVHVDGNLDETKQFRISEHLRCERLPHRVRQMQLYLSGIIMGVQVAGNEWHRPYAVSCAKYARHSPHFE